MSNKELAQRIDTILDSDKHKFTLIVYNKLYDELVDASHTLWAAHNDSESGEAVFSAVKLAEAIPAENINKWIESEVWENLIP